MKIKCAKPDCSKKFKKVGKAKYCSDYCRIFMSSKFQQIRVKAERTKKRGYDCHSVLESFWARTKRAKKPNRFTDTPCLEWQGGLQSDGYGEIGFNGRTMTTHRFAWFTDGRDIPEGQQLNHRCHNRICCDVTHIYLGDQANNMKDRMDLGWFLKNRSNGQ